MGQNQIKKDILMALMHEGYMATDLIPLLTKDKRYFHMVRHDLVEDNYVIKRKRTVSYQDIKRVVNYLAITPKGVQWLIDNCSDQYPWLKCLPNPVPDFSLQYITNDVQFHRNLKTISASVMFSLFRIKTYRVEEQISNTKNIPFKVMVNNAKKAYGLIEELYAPNNSTKAVKFIAENDYENDGMFFYSKDMAKTSNISKSDINQYLFSSYIGLLTNCSIHYLIYPAKPQGMVFKNNVVKREQRVASLFLTNLFNKPTMSEVVMNGIVLCKDKKEFKALFEGNMQAYQRGKDKSRHRLSLMFNHLYAFIMSRPAFTILGYILYFNGEQAKSLREYLLNTCDGFTEKDTLYGTDFLYNGTPAFIGVDMDLTRIQNFAINMNSQAESDLRSGMDPSERRYTVVCYEHQREYYEAILPDMVDYYIVDYNLIKLLGGS